MNTTMENFSSDTNGCVIDIGEWLDGNDDIVTCIIAPPDVDSNGEAVNKAVVQIHSDVFIASVFITVE